MRSPSLSHVYPRRFTIAEYHRLMQSGVLRQDERIELIRGELIQMAARGTAHETCITRLLRVLPEMVGDRATLRCQSPIAIAPDSESEPDFSIVQNREDDYLNAHPTAAETLMVIEVSDSSLDYDRQMKLPLYAEAGISDYWIFNVRDRTLEAYYEPREFMPDQVDYAVRRILISDQAVPFPPFPDQTFSLSTIFPPLSPCP